MEKSRTDTAQLPKMGSPVKGHQAALFIYVTNDFKQFKHVSGNRILNQFHLANLKKSIEEENLLSSNPIIVNENLHVIDGQHRLAAARELELPIYYVISAGYDIDEIQRLNSNVLEWSLEDYAAAYAAAGIEDYQIYLKFREEHKLNHGSAVYMLAQVAFKAQSQVFREGKFKIKSIEVAENLIKSLNDFAEHYKGYRRRSFINAVMELLTHEEYQHYTMLSQLNKQQNKLVDSIDKYAYLRQLLDIYNFKLPENQQIRFKALN